MIELLAPAGTPEAFRTAVAAGADAVYLGGYRFGARHFAGNFDDAALEETIGFAHLRGVKVYVTVNTLVHDEEFADLIWYLLFLCSIGVDAIIIQDVGVLSLASELFSGQNHSPALHASTQMAIHNREGARYTMDHGCARVVLARELSAREIKDIAESLKEQGGEVEIFGHGALCYSYSGQCLLSAVIGGRSGNRGMCAQPCRKPYQLIQGKKDPYGRLSKIHSVSLPGQYLLSTRDLSVYPVFEAIATLPVASLKIEGRMRSPSYVSTVVSTYRRALDAVSSGTFTPTTEEETNLALAFSRGFTTGYLNDEEYQTVMGRDMPGRRGLLVGTVTGFDKNGSMILQQAGDLIPERGDGMVCFSHTDEQGFVLRRDPLARRGEILIDSGVTCQRGDRVYLTSRGTNARALDLLMEDPDRRFLGSIHLKLKITITPEGYVDVVGDIETRDGLVLPFWFRSTAKFNPARSRPLTSDQIGEALKKTGGTLFSLNNPAIICPEGLFAPVSILNGIRREILRHAEARIIEFLRPVPEVMRIIQERADSCLKRINSMTGISFSREHEISVVVVVSDPVSALAAVSAGAERVYIEWYPRTDRTGGIRSLDAILSIFAQDHQASTHIGIKLPKILRRSEMDYLYDALPRITARGVRYIMTDGIGVAEALQAHAGDFVFSGYAGLNITNHYSLATYTGFEFCTLSCELSGNEIAKTISGAYEAGILLPVGVIVQGLLEAVITEDRPGELSPLDDPDTAFGLKDQKGQVFPFVTDPSGRTHIFNAAETSLIEKVPALRESGVRYGVIDARWRGAEYAREITRIWTDVFHRSASLQKQEEYEVIKEEIRKYAHGVLTSATWKRGLCGEE